MSLFNEVQGEIINFAPNYEVDMHGQWIFPFIEIGDRTLNDVHVPAVLHYEILKACQQNKITTLYMRGNLVYGLKDSFNGIIYWTRDGVDPPTADYLFAKVMFGATIILFIFSQKFGFFTLLLGIWKMFDYVRLKKVTKFFKSFNEKQHEFGKN